MEGADVGVLPAMAALTKVLVRDLWTSFPEGDRKDVLGLLGHAPGAVGSLGRASGGGDRR